MRGGAVPKGCLVSILNTATILKGLAILFVSGAIHVVLAGE